MIIRIGPLTDFPEGRGVAARIANRRIAVFRMGAEVFAVENNCPHRNFPLHDGVMNAETVRCRTHGSCFNLRTGALICGPARRDIPAYPAAIVGDHIEIEIPD